MAKPIESFSLGDIKEYCIEHDDCDSCIFYDGYGVCVARQACQKGDPCDWNIGLLPYEVLYDGPVSEDTMTVEDYLMERADRIVKAISDVSDRKLYGQIVQALLDVRDGEIFDLKLPTSYYSYGSVSENGEVIFHNEDDMPLPTKWLSHVLVHPECVIHHRERILDRKNLVDKEKEILEVFPECKYVSKDNGKDVIDLWREHPEKDGGAYYAENEKDFLACLSEEFFPSIKEGECVKIK